LLIFNNLMFLVMKKIFLMQKTRVEEKKRKKNL